MFPFASGCSIDIAMGFDISQGLGHAGHSGPQLHSLREIHHLQEIVEYISSLQHLCCISITPINTNIAFRIVDIHGSIMSDFNFEEYDKEVMKKVLTTSLSAPTFFNSALLKSFKEKFAKSKAGVKVSLVPSQVNL